MCWIADDYAFCTPDANNFTDPSASMCCNLTRASGDSRDLGFGYEGQFAGMAPERRRVNYLHQIGATIKRWQGFVMLLVGLSFVLAPHFCTVHFLASQSFLEQNGLVVTQQERINEMQHRNHLEVLKAEQEGKEENRGFALKAIHSWLGDLLGPDAQEQEIQEGEEMLAEVINAKAERLAALKPPAVLYNPTRLYGSSYVAFGITSLLLPAATPEMLLNVAIVSIVPYSCSLGAFFVSAIDNQLASMESSTYMMVLFGAYAGMIAFWSWLAFSLKDAINALRFKNQDIEISQFVTATSDGELK